MTQSQPPPVRTTVYLDAEIRERLDAFCQKSRRTISNAINLLLDDGLLAWESDPELDPNFQRIKTAQERGLLRGKFFPLPGHTAHDEARAEDHISRSGDPQ